MSSAILYVAIVAIWIGVLVPRWLKHESSPSGLRRLSRHFGTHPADEPDARAGFDPDGRPRYTSFVSPEPGPGVAPEVAPESQTHAPASHSKSRYDYREDVSPAASGNKKSMTELYEAHAPRPAAPSYGWSADEVARQEHLGTTPGAQGKPSATRAGAGAHAPAPASAPQETPGAHATAASHGPARPGVRLPAPRGSHHDEVADAERRAQIVRGRRRMLWLLLVLTAVGIGLAYLRLAAWWVMIPPTVLLIGYLLLLREAAHADAEARERRQLAHATAPAAPAATPAGEAAPSGADADLPVEETGPRADIIDLSEHVGDQLYDQYADAKLRAVGD